MTTAGAILDVKGREVLSTAPEDLVYDAIQAMARHGVGALLVMEGDAIVGILSERDYARKIILQDRSSRSTYVREIMMADVVTVGEDTGLADCMALMTDRRIRHLPVVHEGRVTGMLSIGDLVKAIISEQQNTIEFLEKYITA